VLKHEWTVLFLWSPLTIAMMIGIANNLSQMKTGIDYEHATALSRLQIESKLIAMADNASNEYLFAWH